MTRTVWPFVKVSVWLPTTPQKLYTQATSNPRRFALSNTVNAPSKGPRRTLWDIAKYIPSVLLECLEIGTWKMC